MEPTGCWLLYALLLTRAAKEVSHPHPLPSDPLGSRSLGVTRHPLNPGNAVYAWQTLKVKSSRSTVGLHHRSSYGRLRLRLVLHPQPNRREQHDWNPHFGWIRTAPTPFDNLNNLLSLLPALAQHVCSGTVTDQPRRHVLPRGKLLTFEERSRIGMLLAISFQRLFHQTEPIVICSTRQHHCTKCWQR